MNEVEFVSWRRDRRWTGWHLSFLKGEETLCSRFFDKVLLVNREREASICCKLCTRMVIKILVEETRQIIKTPIQGESSMTSLTPVAQPVTVPLEQKHFRMSRTFRAFNRTRNDIERLVRIGDRDRHAAVQAALHVLAAELCQKIGLTDAAFNINQRYQMEIIPAAQRATEPLVKGVGRKPRAKALPAALNEATQEAPTITERPAKRVGIRDYKGKLPPTVAKWMRKKHPRGRPPKEVSEWVRKNLVAA